MPITFTTPGPHTAIVTASIGGALDLATVSDLHGHVDALLAEESVTGIVLDLSALTFLDSSGIGALMGCLQKANAGGKSLRVENANGLIRDVLTLTNVLPVLSGKTSPDGQ